MLFVQESNFKGINDLRAKGRPIPENDIWIAALSRQHKRMLATQDAHFDEIDGIETIKW